MGRISNFMLERILISVMPEQTLAVLSDGESFERVIRYVDRSIGVSVFYVKWPERIWRPFLFLIVSALRACESILHSSFSCRDVLSKIASVHPLVGDSIRLYLLLSMYAAYEDAVIRASIACEIETADSLGCSSNKLR